MRFFFPALLLTLFSVTSANANPAWPQFRGPTGQGHASGNDVPLTWSETENIRWKTPIPGRGWSSPVVLGDQIWMTSAIEQYDKSDKTKEAGTPTTLILKAICVNRISGKIVQNIDLFQVNDPEKVHKLNSYASPTPVLEPGKVYCHFGTFGTAAVDTRSGKILWQKKSPVSHSVGAGGSPILFEDLLILIFDGIDVQYVTALDKNSGSVRWKTNRTALAPSTPPESKKSFCTPLITEVDGKPQMISPASQWVVGYNPRDGKPIWRGSLKTGFSIVPRPVVADGMTYICSGYSTPNLYAFELGGKGDVTKTHTKWIEKKQIPTMPSLLVKDGLLYLISNTGVTSCLNAKTGSKIWNKRISGNYSSSPVLIGDRIYISSREGKTTVFATGKKYRQLAENQLDGAFYASPAIVDNTLILRTDKHLYCIGESAQ